MKQIKGDLLWGAMLTGWLILLIQPTLRDGFIGFTGSHPYMGGFIKFAILATMGDLLGGRILNGEWRIPQGFAWKAAVWGVMGMMITLIFTVFMAGTAGAQTAGKLPLAGIGWAQALFASVLMNMTFGPMLYIYHKFGDLIVDLMYERADGRWTGTSAVKELTGRIDWQTMVGFSWLKTCTLVWMPCHTIVFLLPEQYRVLASAFLSILLGILVALSKKGHIRPEVSQGTVQKQTDAF